MSDPSIPLSMQADVRDLRARLDAVEAQVTALRKPQP